MSEHGDATQPVREALAAHGLSPTDEEVVMYSFIAPLLRSMTEQLYAVEIGDEL